MDYDFTPFRNLFHFQVVGRFIFSPFHTLGFLSDQTPKHSALGEFALSPVMLYNLLWLIRNLRT